MRGDWADEPLAANGCHCFIFNEPIYGAKLISLSQCPLTNHQGVSHWVGQGQWHTGQRLLSHSLLFGCPKADRNQMWFCRQQGAAKNHSFRPDPASQQLFSHSSQVLPISGFLPIPFSPHRLPSRARPSYLFEEGNLLHREDFVKREHWWHSPSPHPPQPQKLEHTSGLDF